MRDGDVLPRRLLCAKRHDLSLVSMMARWWVTRSGCAVVILASPKTGTHSPNSRSVVMVTQVFSQSR